MTWHKQRKKMSKSHIPVIRTPRVKVLRGYYDSPPKGKTIRLHSHPFWQLELIEIGKTDCILGDEQLILRAGDILLIPPETSHSFVFRGQRRAYLWVNFQVSNWPAVEIPHHPLPDFPTIQALRHALPPLLKSSDRQLAHATIRHLLAAALTEVRHHLTNLSNIPRHNHFITRAEHIISSQQGRKFSVAQLAEALGISTGYLNARFHAIRNFSPKFYMDQQRAHRALELLRYSDQMVYQIAEQLEFPDSFTFSRFVKRHFGVSPRHFLEKRSKLLPHPKGMLKP